MGRNTSAILDHNEKERRDNFMSDEHNIINVDSDNVPLLIVTQNSTERRQTGLFTSTWRKSLNSDNILILTWLHDDGLKTRCTQCETADLATRDFSYWRLNRFDRASLFFFSFIFFLFFPSERFRTIQPPKKIRVPYATSPHALRTGSELALLLRFIHLRVLFPGSERPVVKLIVHLGLFRVTVCHFLRTILDSIDSETSRWLRN